MLVYRDESLRVHKLGPLRCNCYLVIYGDTHLLVDTSVVLERRRLFASLRRLGVETLDAVVLTHAHLDHVGNAAALQKRFGCPVYMQAQGAALLEKGRCAVPVGATVSAKLVESTVKMSRAIWTNCEPCAVVDILEMPVKQLLGRCAYVLETPGHTPDSISLVLGDGRKGGAAVVGDVMIGRNGPFPPFAADKNEVVLSWQKLLFTGCHTFLPGHGSPVGLEKLREAEKINSPRLLHTAGPLQTAQALKGGQGGKE